MTRYLRIYLFSCLFYVSLIWRKIKGKGKGEGEGYVYPSTTPEYYNITLFQ